MPKPFFGLTGKTLLMLAAAVLTLSTWSGPSGFVQLPPSAFTKETAGQIQVWTVDVNSKTPFAEVVPSWNIEGKGSVRVEIQGLKESTATKKYSLGVWSLDPSVRTSLNDQSDAEASVYTDTLVFAQDRSDLRLTLTLVPDSLGVLPQVKQFYLSFTQRDWKPSPASPTRLAWGTELDVPKKAQHNYPNGNVLCSPTCVSMLLNFWAAKADRKDLALDVPEVRDAVFDPAWGGTGNWPFNLAFPSSFPGVTGFVTRLHSINQAEEMIEAGIPIACSVNYKVLLDKTWDGDGGHLVVLTGFTKDGDPIINDPAKGAEVRQIYPRERFLKAWASSKQTVYVITLAGHSLPSSPGPWPRQAVS